MYFHFPQLVVEQFYVKFGDPCFSFSVIVCENAETCSGEKMSVHIFKKKQLQINRQTDKQTPVKNSTPATAVGVGNNLI